MHFRKILLVALLFISANTFAQQCDCPKEFSHIKNFIETNYVGFNDKIKMMTRSVYNKQVKALEAMAAGKTGKEKCLLIIYTYLQGFKDAHVQVSSIADPAKYDTAYIASRERINISDKQLARLRNSKGMEGIYYLRGDSTYKIAVMKSPTLLRDYVAVILESKAEAWKKGMVKFEAKKQPDGVMKGVLYMRNHMPNVNWFVYGDDLIGGTWQREGTKYSASNGGVYQPVASRKLSDKTLYIKISTFNSSNGVRIDSVFKANKGLLDSLPYLVLDLRDNGGGADFTYEPIIPYIYTNPIKTIGIDVLATDSSIAGWSRILDDKDIPQTTKDNLQKRINIMKANKGKLVNIFDDDIDSSYTGHAYPKKVVVLVNENCASTTEQFLFAAKQSTKVIIAGTHTEGVLDYSNVRETNFPCLPYVLGYSSTRSRRIEAGQGIDNVGIKPDVFLDKKKDWIEEAQKLLEK